MWQMYMMYLLVGYGGLRDIRVESGETIIIFPATGGFGGAAVQVAITMGARVIAMGRNQEELARLKTHIEASNPKAEIHTISTTGNGEVDVTKLQEFDLIDAVLDLTPVFASQSMHFQHIVPCLRRGARVSLMGFGK
jgi:D-arabinose 1-dehydrogenase-like Zn-dependent alcohol dehydrogenase